MSGSHSKKKRSLLDNAFLAFEAAAHIYLVVYLISINAALLAIGFTLFELIMFVRLLRKGVKPQDAYCDDICPWKRGEEQKDIQLVFSHVNHYRYCNCLADSAVCCREECWCKEE